MKLQNEHRAEKAEVSSSVTPNTSPDTTGALSPIKFAMSCTVAFGQAIATTESVTRILLVLGIPCSVTVPLFLQQLNLCQTGPFSQELKNFGRVSPAELVAVPYSEGQRT